MTDPVESLMTPLIWDVWADTAADVKRTTNTIFVVVLISPPLLALFAGKNLSTVRLGVKGLN
jgi:hypothetical protein